MMDIKKLLVTWNKRCVHMKDWYCVCVCTCLARGDLSKYILVTDKCLHGQYQSQGFCRLFLNMTAHLGSKDRAILVYLDL